MSKELREAAIACKQAAASRIEDRALAELVARIADDVLERRLEDDDESVTEEWLRSVGFRETEESDDYFAIIRRDQISVCCEDLSSTTTWCMRGQEFMRSFKTRGDVRRLLTALGCEVSSKR